MVLHASLDRVFQTPSFDNILISSSPHDRARPSLISSSSRSTLPRQLLRRRSHPGFFTRMRPRRQLLSPRRARLCRRRSAAQHRHQLSDRLQQIRHLRRRRQTLSDSLGVPSPDSPATPTWSPTFGFQLREAFSSETTPELRRDSAYRSLSCLQDQRNTVQARFQYRVTHALWLASGVGYGSGLPFTYTGDAAEALAQYGPPGHQPYQFSPRPHSSCACCQCVYRRRHLQERTHDHSLLCRRRETSITASMYPGFWRALLRKCNCAGAQLRTSPSPQAS